MAKTTEVQTKNGNVQEQQPQKAIITVNGTELSPKHKTVVIDTTTGKELGAAPVGVWANPRQDCIAVTITLWEKNGEFADIQGKGVPTIPGYMKLNQYAGLNVYKPNQINSLRPTNPYVVTDDLGFIKEIHGRAIAIGHNPLGQIVLSDVTHSINMSVVIAQDILSKVKNNPEVGIIAPAGNCPETWIGEVEVWEDDKEENKRVKKVKKVTGNKANHMGYFPIQTMPVSMGIFYNLQHPDIMDVYADALNRQKHIQSTVMNIATRNAIAAHPAISIKSVMINGSPKPKKNEMHTSTRWAQVQVFCSKSLTTQEQLNRFTEKIEKGEKLADEGALVIEVETVHDETDITDLKVDVAEEVTTVETEPTQPQQQPESQPHGITRDEIEGRITKKISPFDFTQKYGKGIENFSQTELTAILGELEK